MCAGAYGFIGRGVYSIVYSLGLGRFFAAALVVGGDRANERRTTQRRLHPGLDAPLASLCVLPARRVCGAPGARRAINA